MPEDGSQIGLKSENKPGEDGNLDAIMLDSVPPKPAKTFLPLSKKWMNSKFETDRSLILHNMLESML